jgi:hypothetical protein
MVAQVKLDDQEISAREFWKRQIIIAKRQKRPTSFGFYSPAIGDDEGDGNINRKRVCNFNGVLSKSTY